MQSSAARNYLSGVVSNVRPVCRVHFSPVPLTLQWCHPVSTYLPVYLSIYQHYSTPRPTIDVASSLSSRCASLFLTEIERDRLLFDG
ncbi:hypothetical protein I7I48_07412 [Histoplasma ohiense]|nr:hypothetical protein I7I48_07412 [Histoplasma ohiense (nom. inval.)]